MLKKFIERSSLFVLAIALCLSFVLAEGSWDSFNEKNISSEILVENLDDDLSEMGIEESELFDNPDLDDSSFENKDSFEYTLYFYIALGVGVFGLLIVVLFLYLFFKRPKNKWKK